MYRKLFVASFLVFALLGLNLQMAFAQSNQDWNQIASEKDKQIAVKPTKGKTLFGKINSGNDNELVIQIADRKGFTSQTKTFSKIDVDSIWSANLNFKDKSALGTAIGAGVGAGVGLGAGLGLLGATGGSDSSGEILAITTAIGAGAGALVGFFAGRSRHQKQDLIYKKQK